MTKPTKADATIASATNAPTILEVIIDETSSMGRVQRQTVDAYNAFISDQKAMENAVCKVTMTKFSSSAVETPYEMLDLAMAPKLTTDSYLPNGMTNLYDVIGSRINALKSTLGDTKCNVVFLVITDGEDNTSREYKRNDMPKLLGDKMEENGWTFVYLGAHSRALEEAVAMGFPEGNVKMFAQQDIAVAMNQTSAATTAYRSARASGVVEVGTASFAYYSGE